MLPILGCGSTPGCVFPFKYLGIEYNTCVYFNSDNAWCSSEVDDQGNHVGSQIPCSPIELATCEAQEIGIIHFAHSIFYMQNEVKYFIVLRY